MATACGRDSGVNKQSYTDMAQAMGESKTLFMIGNAHIDPVWLWQWYEGMQEIKATFRSALDRLNEYEDFVFTASSAAFYAWIEENEPEMFSEIQTRVAEGRWELVGGWWVEPDCNIPSGEALVRQGLYGQRFFFSRFGKYAHVGYNPDSFGHNASIPQLLKRSGIDFYIFMRPGPHENNTLHQVFRWEANDGSQVLTYRIPYSYTVWGKQLESHIRRCSEDIPVDMDFAMSFYGVGNHGGGPTRQNIDAIHNLNNEPDLPDLVFGSTERYFNHILQKKTSLPVVSDELQHHAVGCYAAHSGIKRWNRQAENALLTAEKWATLANRITGLRYPKQELESAWKMVLFNQFHDILAGTSVESAYEDAHHAYNCAVITADQIRNAAFQKIAWSVATSPDEAGYPLVVFNPHAWESRVPVEVELGWFERATYTLVDAHGTPVTYQEIHPHTSLLGSTRLCFIAELPALGYHTYYIIPHEQINTPVKRQRHTIQPQVYEWENRWFRIAFDVKSGQISNLYDVQNGCKVFTGSASRAIVIDDPSDTWSHGIKRYDGEITAFTGKSIQILEQGAVKTTIRVTSMYGVSRLIQDYTLYNTLPKIDVHVMVDWHEHFKTFKLCFPINVTAAVATYEIPYGHIIRPTNGEEEPGQTWVDVSGVHADTENAYGLSLLNDAKYSYSIAGSELCLTVLRSPIYAHHQPYEPDPEGIYTFMDQGEQHFTYSLLPHTGTWKDAGTIQYAAELNQPPFAIKETSHSWGHLPLSQRLLTASPHNIVITALKMAEDSEDMIVRCYETQNIATKGTLTILGRNNPIIVNFRPCEIKTMRIPSDATLPVIEVNLLEIDP
jgi:alpha-mannosidase